MSDGVFLFPFVFGGVYMEFRGVEGIGEFLLSWSFCLHYSRSVAFFSWLLHGFVDF